MTDIPASAVISEDGKYRYVLARSWEHEGPLCVFVLLNPSTADAIKDDPTVRRCVGFARRFGCGALEIVNLFAFRSTDPRKLKVLSKDEAVGPLNDEVLREERVRVAERGGFLIAGWGTHGKLFGRDAEVKALLGGGLLCLGPTKHGHPRHPLYLPNTVRLTPLP